jgi:glycosyltransferase involved in cell wall biosynthesis
MFDTTIKAKSLKYYELSFISSKNHIKLTNIFNITIFPTVQLPNIIFTNNSNNLTKIFFKNISNNLNIKISCINKIYNIKLTELTQEIFQNNVNLVLQKCSLVLDINVTYYYLKLNLIKDDIFKENIIANYNLLKDSSYLDDFIFNLKLDLNDVIKEEVDVLDKDKDKDKDKEKETKVIKKIKILYLVDMSIQYENIGYTLRSHNILKVIKQNNIDIIACTRYGYPYDRLKDASYVNLNEENLKNIQANFTLDNVTYVKLLNEQDNSLNYSNYTLVTYLKNYIIHLIKLAHKLNISHIHSNSDFLNGIACLYATEFLNIKSTYEVRGFWDESTVSFNPSLKNSDTMKLYRNLELFICSRIQNIITLNLGLAKEINQKNIIILQNGVDTENIKPNFELDYNREIFEEFNINLNNKSNNNIILGYIGSLLSYEGINYILEAINILKNHYNITFLMFGDGLEKQNLINQALKLNLLSNIFVGKFSHLDIIKYYNIIDIIIYPRLNINLCRTTCSSKIFEAMCMSKCILVSNLPAYEDIIINNVTGLFFESENLLDLVNKLKILMNNKTLRQNLGENARNYILKNKSWNIVVEPLIKLYLN